MCVTLINCSEPETKDMEIERGLGKNGFGGRKKGMREEMGKLLLNHLLSTDLSSSLGSIFLGFGWYWTVCVQPDVQSLL